MLLLCSTVASRKASSVLGEKKSWSRGPEGVLRQELEPEVTAKVARKGWRVYEMPISYHGRAYAEGKKITWRDGLKAIWCILRYNLFG